MSPSGNLTTARFQFNLFSRLNRFSKLDSGLMQRIEADVLITGTNDVVKNGCVLIDGTKISFAGPIESAPKQNYGDVTTNVRVIMPGMWDAHAHLVGLKTSDLSEDLRTRPLCSQPERPRTQKGLLLPVSRASEKLVGSECTSPGFPPKEPSTHHTSMPLAPPLARQVDTVMF